MAGEQVLIVDDEVDVLELCERILKTKGYHTQVARDGFEAIDLAAQQKFDLLLTDIKMPVTSGLEIAQFLKKSDPGIICVAMTGYSTMDMVLDALKLGIDEFILKPFTPDELTATILKATEKERLRKENFRLRSLLPLFELNKTLMGTINVEAVLDRLLEISQQETKAHLAGLYTFENHKILAYAGCHPPESADKLTSTPCDELARMSYDQGVQISLILGDGSAENQQILQNLNLHSIIVTPIQAKETNLGALILGHQDNKFAAGDRDFISILCSQAAIALENARLFTAIQEAYKELQKLDHMKREFINIAAHELRTPLTILMGYASVLEEETKDQNKEYAISITRNGMRLRSLIEDMLNLKYLESGIATLTHDKLELSLVMEDILKDMALLAEEKTLDIRIDIPEDFPIITADRQKFDLIVMNLFHNAIKFTPNRGQVTLKAHKNRNRVFISISDTGIGIPHEKFDKIFDRFYQVEPSLTREYGGIGLGLAIVRSLVEICGGEITVESEQGQGTSFTFSLPIDNTKLQPRRLEL